jgi:hypothetical protein
LNKKSFTTNILWLVFFSVLLVLFPHAAWAFANWEPTEGIDFYGVAVPQLSHYMAAFAFEAAIAVLTHKLSEKISKTKPIMKMVKNIDGTTTKVTDIWKTFVARYVNSFSFLLIIFTGVSIMGNLAHAVEFGREMAIFAAWGIPKEIYVVAFGGSLPIISLGFASVLSNVVEDEEAPNPELQKAETALAEAKKALRESELRLKAAEEKARLADERFGRLGELVKNLFAEEAQKRIVSAYKLWSKLPQASIAIIANASPSFVSETLKQVEAETSVPSPT